MRRLTLVIILVLVSVSLIAVPALAGKGSPATEQQGNETGKAKQAGPGGPNYGRQTPTPTIPTPPTPTPQVPASGLMYRVYLPSVANRVGESVSPSSGLAVQWK